jgi:hypothetical protein
MQDQQKYILRLEYQLQKMTEKCRVLEEHIAYMQALARYGLETLPSRRVEGITVPLPPTPPQSIIKRFDNRNEKNINNNHLFFD